MEKYNASMRIMHWLVGVLIIAILALGLYMTGMPDGDPKWEVYAIHKSLGMIALFLFIIRFINRMKSNVPAPEGKAWEIKLSKANYSVLYVLMFVAPFSGYSASSLSGYPVSIFGYTVPNIYSHNPEIGKIFGQMHDISTYALMFFIALHVAGFLKHLIIDKRNLLKKIV